MGLILDVECCENNGDLMNHGVNLFLRQHVGQEIHHQSGSPANSIDHANCYHHFCHSLLRLLYSLLQIAVSLEPQSTDHPCVQICHNSDWHHAHNDIPSKAVNLGENQIRPFLATPFNIVSICDIDIQRHVPYQGGDPSSDDDVLEITTTNSTLLRVRV